MHRERTHRIGFTGIVGMTLVELLVATGVVILLASLGVNATLAAQRHAVVRTAAADIAGFLQQTAGFALNGVKAAGCTPATAVNCSQYRVTVSVGEKSLQRQAVGGGVIDTRTFATVRLNPSASTVEFRYSPPVLDALPAPFTLVVQHPQGAPTRNVCVSARAAVEVRSGTCP